MTIKVICQAIFDDVVEMRALKIEIDELTKRYDVLKKNVIGAMGESEVMANIDGEFLCTYSASKTFKKIDLEQLAFDEPELHSRLLSEYGSMSKSFKTFRLTK